jgi:hypothetical protein
MGLTDSWVAGREAVHAFARFSLDQRWVFHEVPGHADFGKDGYVDLVEASGAVTGGCFSVQIKGGRSYRRSGGYRIDGSENNRRQWAASTLPVIGIAWDPDRARLHWADLSATLNSEGLDAELHVPESQHLNGEPELRRFKKYVSSVAHRQASTLDLVSNDDDLQLAGVAAAYYVGRTDGRALILLRRLLFSMGEAARRSAVWALACAVPHSDIFHTFEGSPDPEACRVLEPTLRWTVDEIIELLALIDDEQGIDRGTFGQHVYHLLVMDPAHATKTADATIEVARRGTSTASAWGLVLAIHFAGDDGDAEFRRLLSAEPALGETWAAEQITQSLRDFGYVSLF